MGGSSNGSLNEELSRRTSIFGLRLWTVIGICIGAVIVLVLFVLSVWLTSRRRSKGVPEKSPSAVNIPAVFKDIREVRSNPRRLLDGNLVSPCRSSRERDMERDDVGGHGVSPTPVCDVENANPERRRKILSRRVNSPADNLFLDGERRELLADKASNTSADSRSTESVTRSPAPNPMLPEVSHLGWGHWYTLRDLEAATDGFTDTNVIGEGGYGIVYQGRLVDGTVIAVKNLLNNRGQAEREFRVEVEAIGRVRHKNLVRLLGYCAEGSYRMLVYEYVNNGNLEQWLHGHLKENQSVSWERRMKIVIGTAKGLQYLHEGLEPKVVHRDIKASNILLDSQWNAKVSDFGLAKLLGSDSSHVTTRVMGTFGYVAPEYASTGLLNEKSDVYSFGVLLMEVITGREPVDCGRPATEVKLVDWLKMMVAARRSDEVLDPAIDSMPSARALKRVLLVALRCVDPDYQKRPKMGQVVYMLEADDLPFRDERRVPRDALPEKSSPHQEAMSQSYNISRDSLACKAIEHHVLPQRTATRKDCDHGIDSFSNRARQKRYEG